MTNGGHDSHFELTRKVFDPYYKGKVVVADVPEGKQQGLNSNCGDQAKLSNMCL